MPLETSLWLRTTLKRTGSSSQLTCEPVSLNVVKRERETEEECRFNASVYDMIWFFLSSSFKYQSQSWASKSTKLTLAASFAWKLLNFFFRSIYLFIYLSVWSSAWLCAAVQMIVIQETGRRWRQKLRRCKKTMKRRLVLSTWSSHGGVDIIRNVYDALIEIEEDTEKKDCTLNLSLNFLLW